MEKYYFQFVLTLLMVAGYWFVKWSVAKLMMKLGAVKEVPAIRIKNVTRYFNIMFLLVLAVMLMMVWGVDYRGLLVFASSVLAVIGVALVAQWSILSNITAGVIVFFSFPARIGDTIEIVDGAHRLRGTITEINLFQVLLVDENNQRIAYPNNLILQRPVINIVPNLKEEKTEKSGSLFAQRTTNR
ncbi:hypothetical protein THMIRHAM_20290 [Thiomicrorhabdus immobilis]|uniref:Small-conductance mechanosensitive channel n=1 Tax=Thiomicrorhabdus immobilis TaxID=2791037 RepID=A0ABN6CZZ5_9GAMM|nr:mechanosensitive ion channel family protein [Thiomicrorhabdus immobilis]BCN94244.1 hypothetical protein THMIRHAM_20290 [Thiomicrorhabdus immobilis]